MLLSLQQQPRLPSGNLPSSVPSGRVAAVAGAGTMQRMHRMPPASGAMAVAPYSTAAAMAKPQHAQHAQQALRRGSLLVPAATALATPPTVSPTATTFPSSEARSHSHRNSGSGRKSSSLAREAREVGLLAVPGVGRKNEALLRDKGLQTLQQLRDMHAAQHGGDAGRTRAFLQDEVGIRNKGHVNSIVDYLSNYSSGSRQSAGAAAAGQGLQGQGQQVLTGGVDQGLAGVGVSPHAKVTLSVEGNISAGKSTFLQILKDSITEEDMRVVPEPVDKWQNVGEGQVNLLMEFYQNPERFAYTFQNYVFLTRMVQERDSYSQSMCRLLERSVFSDRMVFVRAVHKSKFMNDTELAIYDSWFDPVLATLPTLVPNGFIYLKAEPETCFRRMKKRSRKEEGGVPLDYLQDLHSHHQEWLWEGGEKATASKYLHVPGSNRILHNTNPSGVNPAFAPPPAGAPSLQLLPPQQLTYQVPSIPSELKENLRILDATKGKHMLHHLDQIPALVLDCDLDVDIDRDQQYRDHVARQVQLYKVFVREFMQAKAAAQAPHLHHLHSPDQFNGYYQRDTQGQILYTSPQYHALAHLQQQQLLTARA